ncbi:MAG: hypothetical protein N4A36_03210 [Candidatus Gracilibacteria bacterium]|jgi:ribosomal protein L33|nr:hypothetical protein [Candidatus Gracilibacteria bacterium]
MPRGKKQQATVAFCKACNSIIQHFYIFNKKENKEKEGVVAKKYCKICQSKQELKLKDEKGKTNK